MNDGYLSYPDAQACITIVQECGEQWDSPTRWQNYLTTGLENIVGGFGAVFGMTEVSDNRREMVEAWIAERNDDDLKRRFGQFVDDGALRTSASSTAVAAELAAKGQYTWREPMLFDRRTFRRGELYQKYLQGVGVSDVLSSSVMSPNGQIIGLTILRGNRDPEFDERASTIVSFLAKAIGSRIGRPLRLRARTKLRLAPRQHEALQLLLRGFSEKQMASELGVTTATAHEYVGAVYGVYGVRTRAELMAAYINRRLSPGSQAQ